MNESLIVKIGADKAEFVKQMASVRAEAASAAAKMAQDSARADEIKLAGAGKIKRALSGVTEQILSGASATDVFAASAVKLAGIFKVGLGAAAGIAIGGVLIKEMMEVNDEADKLRKSIEKIGAPTSSADYSTLDSLKSRLEEIGKLQDALNTQMSAGPFSQFAQGVGRGFQHIGKNIDEHGLSRGIAVSGSEATPQALAAEREKQLETIRKATIDDLEKIAAKQKTIADIEEMRVHQGERVAALAKLDADYKEKRGVLISAGASTGHDTTGEIQQLNRMQALEKEAIQDKIDATERARNLEMDILRIKESGYDVETRTAEARVAGAQADKDAFRTPDAKADAEVKVQAAKDALESAKRTTEEHRRQVTIQIAVAGMQADGDAKHLAQLQMEGEEIQRQLNGAKHDDIPKLTLAKKENESAQQDAMDAASERHFAQEDANARNGAGEDQASQQRALLARAQNADAHAEALKANPRATTEQKTSARNEATKLREEYDKIVGQNKQLVDDTRLENQILNETIRGHSSVAEKLKIELQFRDKIATAEKNGQTELAAQLRTQQALTVAAAQAAAVKANKGEKFHEDPSLTPSENNARHAEFMKHQRDQSRADRKTERDRRNGAGMKGQAQPDVGNQGVTPGPDVSGYDPHAPIQGLRQQGIPGPSRMPFAPVTPADLTPAPPAVNSKAFSSQKIEQLLEDIKTEIRKASETM